MVAEDSRGGRLHPSQIRSNYRNADRCQGLIFLVADQIAKVVWQAVEGVAEPLIVTFRNRPATLITRVAKAEDIVYIISRERNGTAFDGGKGYGSLCSARFWKEGPTVVELFATAARTPRKRR